MLNFCANEFIEIMSVIMLWSSEPLEKENLSSLSKDVEKINQELISINFHNSLLTAKRILYLFKETPDKLDQINQ
jgi:hypothetical protein